MKKKFLAVCLMLVLSLGAVGGSVAAFADVSLEECDLCFQQTASAILEEGEVNGTYIVTRRTPLYDLNLENMGYVYSFGTGLGEGYAIVICDNGNYVAQEFFKSAANPYTQVEEGELCVYAHTMTYLKSVNGVICDIQTSAPISEESLDLLREDAFSYQTDTNANLEYKTVRIEYVSRSYDVKNLCHGQPRFSNNGWTGGCAAVAGGNLIGYYDRYYEDLIPNHTAGISNGELFIYYYADEYVNNMISTLYSYMGGSGAGISEDGFKSGMKRYCSDKGLSCDFTSLKSGGKLSYDSVKSCINGGNPLVLFLNTYTVCTTMELDTYGYIYYQISQGNHVMPGFGYRNVKYTHSDGSVSDYKYINVTTGWGDPKEAYFNIEYCTNIVSAYKVNIY
ncbi:MAG: hypothetical protein K2I17_02715 [Clostridia bacterium]|nr:hypothetical protein [Clostridia bacterium]